MTEGHLNPGFVVPFDDCMSWKYWTQLKKKFLQQILNLQNWTIFSPVLQMMTYV